MKVIGREEARGLGLRRYFTGQPCRRGHVVERRVSDMHCMGCKNISARKWKRENVRKVKASRKLAHEKSREYDNARNREWYRKNKESVLARNKAWRQKNPGKMKEYCRRWNENNRAKNKSRSYRLYYLGVQNPDGEGQWLKKSRVLLRRVKRALRSGRSHEVLQLLSKASAQGNSSHA